MLHGSLVLLAPKELFKRLESAANLLLRDLGQCEDFTERAADAGLATCNKDAACNNGFLGLPFESLCVLDDLEEVLREVRCGLWDMDGIAVGADLLVCGKKVLSALIMGRLVLGALEIAAAAGGIAKGNSCGKLGPVEKRIGTISDTGWVITSLVIVCERAPLGACVDNAISQDEATVSANHVSGRKLFDQVWREELALLANHLHIKVLDVRILGTASSGSCGRHLWFVCVFSDVKVLRAL